MSSYQDDNGIKSKTVELFVNCDFFLNTDFPSLFLPLALTRSLFYARRRQLVIIITYSERKMFNVSKACLI